MDADAVVEKLRSFVQDCLGKHLYSSAAFFADKLVTLTDGAPADVYLLAQAYFISGQHRRALQLLRQEGLLAADVRFRYLAAKCLFESKEYEECLATLGESEREDLAAAEAGVGAAADGSGGRDMDEDGAARAGPGAAGAAGAGSPGPAGGRELSMLSAACLLRGAAHEALQNRPRALQCYRAALLADPFCYEAYEALISNHMLSAPEERELLGRLRLGPDDRWLGLLYACRAKTYEREAAAEAQLEELAEILRPQEDPEGSPSAGGGGGSSGPENGSGASAGGMGGAGGGRGGGYGPAAGVSSAGSGFGFGAGPRQNADVVACRADLAYARGDYGRAYELTRGLLARDPYALQCMPTHLAAAVECRKKNELFLRGHQLVAAYPQRALAWYAVGCYYTAAGSHDAARRYYAKATALDGGGFAPAWVAFGHAFAAQDESDQAMAAYRTAARLFPGSHVAVLCIGLEHLRTNNPALAEQMFQQALALQPLEPLVYNELGVLAYRAKQLPAAEQHFRQALARAPSPVDAAWEPTVVNLGHALRKQGRVAEAVGCFESALALVPRSAGTAAALGFCRHLQGDLASAVEWYHKSLGLRPDDALTQDLLSDALAAFAKRGPD